MKQNKSRHKSTLALNAHVRQVQFVARRAFRSADRSCTRADLIAAFDISAANASLILQEAVRQCGDLARKDRKVVAPQWAAAPQWANEEDLLEHLESGHDAYPDIGLTRLELPISRVTWRKNLSSVPGAIEELARCIAGRKPIFVRYTTLDMGRTTTWRRILPLRLEEVNSHWRVSAQDLELPAFGVRTFALTRIIAFKPDPDPLPKKLIRESPNDALTSLKITFDKRLTGEQVQALQSEFGIRNGCVNVPHRSVHEFMQQFVQGGEASSTAIWPPFESAEVAK